MTVPVLLLLAQAQASATPAQTLRAVALDLQVGTGVPTELATQLAEGLQKAGIQPMPADAPDVPVLRVFAELEEKAQLLHVRVRTLYGDRAALEPRTNAQGVSLGPWPRLGFLAVVRDRDLALQRLKEETLRVALDLLYPPTPKPPTKTVILTDPKYGVKGGVLGGVPGGLVGGMGRVVDLDFSLIEVAYQPPPPPYPPLARIVKIQGTVVVEVTIDTEGLPEEARLLSGPELLAATATAWAMQWRFKPAKVQGKAIKGRFRLTMPFRLRPAETTENPGTPARKE